MRITEENYVEKAEAAILRLKNKKDKIGRPVQMVTTSKLRNLLAMSADIYNEALNCRQDKLPKELAGRIEYLRVRFIYECGREENKGKVKDFVQGAELLEILREIHGERENFILFNRYMEALVAYHKFYDGKDN